MPSLARLWASRHLGGRPIEIPFRQLAELVSVRTGELVIIAGDAGGGKSTLALNWAWRTKDPVLYLALEDPEGVKDRLTAFATNQKLAEIHPDDADYYVEELSEVRDTLIVERGPHSLELVEQRIVALTEWLGSPPPLVFVDNVKDIDLADRPPSTNDYFTVVLAALKQLAIKYRVVVVGLHHSNRGHDATGLGTEPLALGRLLHGGDRDARHVWGVHHDLGKRHLFVQVLKQTHGQADASGSGRVEVRLDWQPENGMLFSV